MRSNRAGSCHKTIHASCVSWLERGILIRGSSGHGKSDLVVRLIEAGAELVADDLVELVVECDKLCASSPASGRGMIELRGQGIYQLPFRERAPLDYVVELIDLDDQTRLPETLDLTLEGFRLPVIRLHPNAASAVARLRIAISANRIA